MSRLNLRFDARLRTATVGAPLRCVFAVCSLLVVASTDRAGAADWPLRGSLSPSYSRWDGFYAGGQAGESFSSVTFSKTTSAVVSNILANTELQSVVANFTTLPKGSTGGVSYGGFVGFNYQMDDVVLGGELNYNHMSLKNSAQDSIGPILVPGANLPDGSTVVYSVALASSASLQMTDVLTARARGGWAVDRFLPYGFFGLAVARADWVRSVSVTGLKSTTPPPVTIPGGGTIPSPQGPFLPLILPRNPQSQSQTQIAYGFTLGMGVDIQLMPNVFFRAEYEFIQFPDISNFRVAMNSVRGGLGVKF